MRDADLYSLTAGGTSASSYCWGNNDAGQLGGGLTSIGAGPTRAFDAGYIGAFDVGLRHACAVVNNFNQISCWGSNAMGAIYAGAELMASRPRLIPSLFSSEPITRVSAADDATCLDSDEGVDYDHQKYTACWGYNPLRRFRDGGTTVPLRTVVFEPSQSGYQLVAWEEVSCFINSNNRPGCYGSNTHSQIEPANTTTYNNLGAAPSIPIDVPITRIAVGSSAVCAVRITSEVACWGTNTHQTLGTSGVGTLTQVVPGISAVSDLALKGDTACVIQNSQVWCWGRNQYG